MELVRRSALEASFDLLLVYGMEILSTEISVPEATESAVSKYLDILEQAVSNIWNIGSGVFHRWKTSHCRSTVDPKQIDI